jgi:hypothetical protein
MRAHTEEPPNSVCCRRAGLAPRAPRAADACDAPTRAAVAAVHSGDPGTVKGTLREKSDISAETQLTHLMRGGFPACHADHGWMPQGSCTT